MSHPYISQEILPNLSLWQQVADKRMPFSIDLELTARCNLDCRHCYINLSAGDKPAKRAELSLDEIAAIADQAISLGSLWCLISGGEPLLREDFADIYLMLKKKGLLVSLFTNACLVTEQHARLFQQSPPRDIEVSVYGVNAGTYEQVTRRPGSYPAFRRGLALLLDSGVKVRLKAMALRSNVDELDQIASFCRQHTTDYFRFDPLLHLRYDGDQKRNAEIRSERLSPQQIVAIEQADQERAASLQQNCDQLILPHASDRDCSCIFHCGAGSSSFTVSYDGFFKLCSSLTRADCTYDLRNGSLLEAWQDFVPQVRALTSSKPDFLSKCHSCPLVNLCLWCPANADLENGEMDTWSDYFCQVAYARAQAIQGNQHSSAESLQKPGKRIEISP
jgi:radical SAM protein with 4Fe4S-binding SPASM domain